MEHLNGIESKTSVSLAVARVNGQLFGEFRSLLALQRVCTLCGTVNRLNI